MSKFWCVAQLECVEPWLESTNHFQRAASLIAIAVMVEGCSVHIKNQSVCRHLSTFVMLSLFSLFSHLPALLQIVYKGRNLFILSLSSLLYLPLGVRDEEKVVRNASLFAIGQFSEHLQVNPYPHSQLRINSSSLPLSPSLSLLLLFLSLPPSSLR